MAKATGGRGVLVPAGWIDLRIVLRVAVAAWNQLEVGTQDGTEHDRQILVVGDHLVFGNGDATSLLVDRFVIPIRVAQQQVMGVTVVAAQQERVQGGQGRVLVHTRIAGLIADAGALLLRIGDRQKLFTVAAAASLELATDEGTQLVGLLEGVSINVRCVEEGGVLVGLLARPKLTGWTDARADEIQTGNIEAAVEAVAWDQDRPAAAGLRLLAAIDEAVVGRQGRV